MKNLKIIAIVLLTLGNQAILAQDAVDSTSISVKEFDKIVLEVSGQVEIESIDGNKILAQSKLFKKGSVWGWKKPSSRPDFEIKTQEKGRNLIVTIPEIFQPDVIGITTYQEEIFTKLRIPESANIEIQDGKSVEVYGNFMRMNTQGIEELVVHNLSKNDIKTLSCFAKEELIINHERKPGFYELESTGEQQYDLNANKLRLSLQ